MMKRLAPVLGAAALLMAACMMVVNTEEDDDGYVTERTTMREGENATFHGDLVITLKEADDDEVEIIVRDDGSERTVEIRDTGRDSGYSWPPYRIWLNSADDDGATITVSRE